MHMLIDMHRSYSYVVPWSYDKLIKHIFLMSELIEASHFIIVGLQGSQKAKLVGLESPPIALASC